MDWIAALPVLGGVIERAFALITMPVAAVIIALLAYPILSRHMTGLIASLTSLKEVVNKIPELLRAADQLKEAADRLTSSAKDISNSIKESKQQITQVTEAAEGVQQDAYMNAISDIWGRTKDSLEELTNNDTKYKDMARFNYTSVIEMLTKDRKLTDVQAKDLMRMQDIFNKTRVNRSARTRATVDEMQALLARVFTAKS